MATFTGGMAAGAAPAPSTGHGSAGIIIRGFINVSANPADGDIYKLCKIPTGCLIFGGVFSGDDMDTGTETLDMDLGWAANGTSSAATRIDIDGTEYTDSGYTADPDGFVNSGVITGDAITSLLAAGKFYLPVALGKPLYFAKETIVQVEANAAAATLASGNMAVVLHGQMIG